MKKLTTYSLASIIEGVEVHFLGKLFRVVKKFKTTVHLMCLETLDKKIEIVTVAQIKKYTKQLAAAGKSFAKEMTEHKKKVVRREYTSVYWSRPPEDIYSKFA